MSLLLTRRGLIVRFGMRFYVSRILLGVVLVLLVLGLWVAVEEYRIYRAQPDWNAVVFNAPTNPWMPVHNDHWHQRREAWKSSTTQGQTGESIGDFRNRFSFSEETKGLDALHEYQRFEESEDWEAFVGWALDNEEELLRLADELPDFTDRGPWFFFSSYPAEPTLLPDFGLANLRSATEIADLSLRFGKVLWEQERGTEAITVWAAGFDFVSTGLSDFSSMGVRFRTNRQESYLALWTEHLPALRQEPGFSQIEESLQKAWQDGRSKKLIFAEAFLPHVMLIDYAGAAMNFAEALGQGELSRRHRFAFRWTGQYRRLKEDAIDLYRVAEPSLALESPFAVGRIQSTYRTLDKEGSLISLFIPARFTLGELEREQSAKAHLQYVLLAIEILREFPPESPEDSFAEWWAEGSEESPLAQNPFGLGQLRALLSENKLRITTPLSPPGQTRREFSVDFPR
ncbi:MAG: hypothetical protein JJT75_02270 [Opitutales bacterium]|nr:hypothetical protein [Opitutales bacterium]